MQRKKVSAEKYYVKSTNFMSRIGKQIIEIPSGVEINVTDGIAKVKSSKGELTLALPETVSLNLEGNQATVSIKDETDFRQKMLWGTIASLVKNMVIGVSDGYSKQLEVNGVGYKVAASGSKLTLNLGYSHPIEYMVPKGVDAKVEKNVITISGIDKQAVGQVASQIRSYRKPEPYKGKGIKYTDEVIIRKAGKAAAGAE
jgi:large subunit ribosomal protein L6